MNMKINHTLVILTILATQVSNGAINYYEPFGNNYPQNVSINSNGWTTTSGSSLVLNGSLARTNLNSGWSYSFVSGGRAKLSNNSLLNQTTTGVIKKELGTTYNQGTYYFSFLMDANLWTDKASAYFGIGDLKIGRSNTNRNTQGLLGLSTGAEGSVNYAFDLSNTYSTFNTHYYVIGLELDANGIDTAYAWLDPINQVSPDLTINGEFSFSNISFNVSGYSSNNSAHIDEIKISDSFSGVSPMPESNSQSLLLLGLISLFFTRKQRNSK